MVPERKQESAPFLPVLLPRKEEREQMKRGQRREDLHLQQAGPALFTGAEQSRTDGGSLFEIPAGVYV